MFTLNYAYASGSEHNVVLEACVLEASDLASDESSSSSGSIYTAVGVGADVTTGGVTTGDATIAGAEIVLAIICSGATETHVKINTICQNRIIVHLYQHHTIRYSFYHKKVECVYFPIPLLQQKFLNKSLINCYAKENTNLEAFYGFIDI